MENGPYYYIALEYYKVTEDYLKAMDRYVTAISNGEIESVISNLKSRIDSLDATRSALFECASRRFNAIKGV